MSLERLAAPMTRPARRVFYLQQYSSAFCFAQQMRYYRCMPKKKESPFKPLPETREQMKGVSEKDFLGLLERAAEPAKPSAPSASKTSGA